MKLVSKVIFKKNNAINIISFILLLFIGSLFIIKYSSRLTNFSFIIVLFYITALLSALSFINNKITPNQNFACTKIHFYFLAAVVILLAVSLHFIPHTAKVAREPAIIDWLNNFSRKSFPYGSKINPSGFPFLFFIASPFYFLGDLGYFEIIGLGLFISIILLYSQTKQELLIRLTFLLLLPTTYYEIFTRSEILTNTVLVLLVFFILQNIKSRDLTKLPFYLSALLSGLLLSTRIIVFPWLVLFLIYYFKHDLKMGVIFFIISTITFLITLLPFYIWNPKLFIENGPFAIQTIYLPNWAFVLFPLLFFYFGSKTKNFQEFLFFTGILTFVLVTISFVWTIYNFGFVQSLFNNKFDISYYIFSIPFLLLAIKE